MSGRNIAQRARELNLSPGLIYKRPERYRVVEARLGQVKGGWRRRRYGD